MMVTVIPVRNLLLRTVRKANKKESVAVMQLGFKAILRQCRDVRLCAFIDVLI